MGEDLRLPLHGQEEDHAADLQAAPGVSKPSNLPETSVGDRNSEFPLPLSHSVGRCFTCNRPRFQVQEDWWTQSLKGTPGQSAAEDPADNEGR